jgi:glycosyltransferase involved in cell wall biosynthesis
MKVIHCVSSIDNPTAGTTYSVDRLTAAVRDEGIDARLYTLGDPARDEPGGFTRRFPNDLVSLPLMRRIGCSRALRDGLLDPTIDLFHIHGLWMMPNVYPADAARQMNRPLMLSPHGMLGPAALQYSHWKKQIAWFMWQGRALREVDCFRATCTEEWGEIRRFGLRQPVAVIPNGIDLPRTPPERRTLPRKQVISIGRIHPKKALDRLIRAWVMLQGDYPDWECLLVGPSEGGHGEQLGQLARELHAERLTISGPVFGDDKLRLLTDADLFALPTLNENFALTVAESLACGTPVISTKGAPWEGLETHRCGWWIDHGPETMAATLRQAMALPEAERRAMGARGRDWVQRDFCWRMIGQQIHAVYDWMINGRDRPECVMAD